MSRFGSVRAPVRQADRDNDVPMYFLYLGSTSPNTNLEKSPVALSLPNLLNTSIRTTCGFSSNPSLSNCPLSSFPSFERSGSPLQHPSQTRSVWVPSRTISMASERITSRPAPKTRSENRLSRDITSSSRVRGRQDATPRTLSSCSSVVTGIIYEVLRWAESSHCQSKSSLCESIVLVSHVRRLIGEKHVSRCFTNAQLQTKKLGRVSMQIA